MNYPGFKKHKHTSSGSHQQKTILTVMAVKDLTGENKLRLRGDTQTDLSTLPMMWVLNDTPVIDINLQGDRRLAQLRQEFQSDDPSTPQEYADLVVKIELLAVKVQNRAFDVAYDGGIESGLCAMTLTSGFGIDSSLCAMTNAFDVMMKYCTVMHTGTMYYRTVAVIFMLSVQCRKNELVIFREPRILFMTFCVMHFPNIHLPQRVDRRISETSPAFPLLGSVFCVGVSIYIYIHYTFTSRCPPM